MTLTKNSLAGGLVEKSLASVTVPNDCKAVRSTASGELSNLDVLRAFAVALVVFSHLPIETPGLLSFIPFHKQALGIFGVYIFFVHTCLVLMHSLERQRLESAGSGLFLPFMVRRIFRIYPLSIFTVTAVYSFNYVYSTDQWTKSELASNLLLIQNVTGHVSHPAALWSLPFEMQMYIALPTLYVVTQSRNRNVVALLLIVWTLAICVVLSARGAGLNYHLVKYLPCFLPGVIAFAMRARQTVFPASTLFVLVALCTLLFAISVAIGAPETPLAWVFCLGLGLLLPFVRETQCRPLAVVSKMIAKYSFSIYLLHGPIIWLVFEKCQKIAWPLQLVAFVVAMLVCCCGAYRFIEAPALRIGVALTSNSSKR